MKNKLINTMKKYITTIMFLACFMTVGQKKEIKKAEEKEQNGRGEDQERGRRTARQRTPCLILLINGAGRDQVVAEFVAARAVHFRRGLKILTGSNKPFIHSFIRISISC